MKKFLSVIWICLILIMLNVTSAFALSYKFDVASNKTVVTAGEEIIVSMNISDIDMGELGINAIEGVLDYDDSVLEVITRYDIVMQNNWTMAYNQEAGAHAGNFLASNIISGIKTEQKIGEVKIKIREDAKPGKTEIKFKNITSNDGQNLVQGGDKSVVIEIVEKNTDNSVTTSPTPKSTTIISNKNDNNIAQGKLPQTGSDFNIIIIAIVAVSIIGIVAYINYKKTTTK